MGVGKKEKEGSSVSEKSGKEEGQRPHVSGRPFHIHAWNSVALKTGVSEILLPAVPTTNNLQI